MHAQKKQKLRPLALAAALTMLIAGTSIPYQSAAAEGSYDMNISIDLAGEHKEISPYIYGINQYGNQENYKDVAVTAVRQGGNRMVAYNWENNASNAGSDWKHSSDNNLSNSDEPADCVQVLSKEAETYGIPYKMTTLQMAGYVSADKNGEVSESEAAPSARWNAVEFVKGSAFAETPDLTDGVVYMDEYLNYIINTLGDSSSATGIQGYSLDNEPVLWSNTHPYIHPGPTTHAELAEKSIALASVIKDFDPNAEVFGPALYGYTAYDHLDDDDTSSEWETLKAENGYHWYLDCYLDTMKKASDEKGVRLLDVLDIHYYSESAREGVEDRLQSVRTLYEEGFVENSWIGQWCQENIPILPTIQKSIDTYYPGTKLAVTEYNFGGEDLSGTIAQAEALGCFADAGLYMAMIWGGNPYQFAGINLYTNYDGNGSSFGDMLVPTVTDDVSLSSAYASIQGNDEGTVTAMVTNKSLTDSENAVITLEGASTEYKAAAVYAVYGDSSDIRLLEIIDSVTDNQVSVTLPAYSAAMVVITDDASDFEGLDIYNPDQYRYETVTFTDLTEVNANGYLEVPVEDPEHLYKVNMTANVTSSAGSSWGSANCALSLNVEDTAGTQFWTSKGYSFQLGSDVTASVEFDHQYTNEDGDLVEAYIFDGKIEFQKWWDTSEKLEAEIDDVINVEYTKIELVYRYENTGETEPETETEAETETPDYGDVDCNGKVEILDVIALSKSLMGAGTLTTAGAANADVDQNSTINTTDALNIMKYLVKLIEVLPV